MLFSIKIGDLYSKECNLVKPYVKPSKDEPARWFICSAGDVFITENGNVPSGPMASLNFPDLSQYTVVYLGELRERPCYLIVADLNDPAFVGGEFVPLRSLLSVHDEEQFAMAGRARQVMDFINQHRFCGRCGARMQAVDWELAMHCQQCNHRCYPRVSPCIIVAIRKEDTLLLARGKRHKQGIYSVLAGFVEPGESLEQALAREVHEEAGIEVCDIEYQLSQPWPFPHSLMMGFTAQWQSGDLHIDPVELETGDWFAIDNLPDTPPEGTIAHRLIEIAIGKAKQE